MATTVNSMSHVYRCYLSHLAIRRRCGILERRKTSDLKEEDDTTYDDDDDDDDEHDDDDDDDVVVVVDVDADPRSLRDNAHTHTHPKQKQTYKQSLRKEANKQGEN